MFHDKTIALSCSAPVMYVFLVYLGGAGESIF